MVLTTGRGAFGVVVVVVVVVGVPKAEVGADAPLGSFATTATPYGVVALSPENEHDGPVVVVAKFDGVLNPYRSVQV